MRVPPGSIAIACLLGLGACAQSDPGGAIPGLADGGLGLGIEPPQRFEEGEALSSLEQFLSTVEGLRWETMATNRAGYLSYLLYFEQPINHQQAEGASFEQRIILQHRDVQAPMVLYTSGYSIFASEYLAELSVAMGANQINVEQRYFGKSKPHPIHSTDWEQLSIAQAAQDHHRIVVALASYYQESWLSTGHSKGGMASIYHRRFFPDDVEATVAYVAPISFGAPDSGYEAYTGNLGPADCRAQLRAVQVDSLERFEQLLPMAQSHASERNLQFVRAGGQAAAFETAIAAMEWSFWQDRGEEDCNALPNSEATNSTLFSFIRKTVGVGADDASLAMIDSYYYQASHQLGYPSISQGHLAGLLQHQDNPVSLYPQGAPAPSFDASAMLDIASWLKSQSAARILFVYGESDPWTGGAFDTASCGECPSFTVPGASHSALLRDLPAQAQLAALRAIERWTGIRPALGQGVRSRIQRPRRAPIVPPIGRSMSGH